MEKKKVLVLSIVLSALLCSCASTYIRPSIQATVFRQQIPGPAAILFKAAQYIVPAMGYKIQGSDPEAGTITTAPVEMKLEPADCDCGNNLGLPVVKSRGTTGQVSFIIGVNNNELTVRTEITVVDTSLLGTLSTGLNIMCVSKGGLEKTLAKNFANKMSENAVKMLFKFR